MAQRSVNRIRVTERTGHHGGRARFPGNTRTTLTKREFLKTTALSLAGLSAGVGCGARGTPAPDNKVIILGFDGLDPGIVERLARAGKLPHLAGMMEQNGLRPLATTVPPLSPVAWSTFTTGTNPGGHGIFDFVHRDPETMTPYLSTTRAEAPARTIQVGDWVVPLSSGSIKLLREGQPFWKVLDDAGIPTTVVRAPANFPPGLGQGQQLSGMGTPDLQGTYGVFSYFTDDASFKTTGDTGGGQIFQVKRTNHQVKSALPGPRNTFRADAPMSAADFTVFIDPANPVAKLALQDHQLLLKRGEWSPWLQVRFDLVPYLQSVSGIVRFYLKETHPHLKLYATPVNIDPSHPALPISTPDHYAHDLCEELGFFYTQGMPHDTKALSSGVLDDGESLEQASIVFDEHARIFDHELARFRRGFLFLYTDRVDQLAHMFWRTMDPQHPLYDPRSPHAGVIETTYRDIDTLVGKALRHADERTTVLVMSDHGFAPFYRAVNLNSWLRDEGYLKLRGTRAASSEAGPFDAVNWSETRAYGLGLNGLYLNLKGRESTGIIPSAREYDRLVRDIAGKLLEVKDPQSGRKAVQRVYVATEVFSGPARVLAPDLVVGYAPDYRVSWDSVLGQLSPAVFGDNTDKWSGDHSIAAESVPGVLLSNRKVKAAQPGLADIGPTVLAEFGIAKTSAMEGTSVF
jgi:predicted AlkP superfamily phosphohydrolase/phosphomutase